MATINFPASPTVNQIYTFNNKSWIFNGIGWATKSVETALTTAGLNANTFKGTQTLGGNQLVKPVLVHTGEYRGTTSIVSGVINLDLLYGIISLTLSGNITSINLLNNFASTSVCQSIAIETTGDGVQRSIVWPAGNGTTTLLVKLPGGTAPTPTLTSGKRDRYYLTSVSQFVWDLTVGGQNL